MMIRSVLLPSSCGLRRHSNRHSTLRTLTRAATSHPSPKTPEDVQAKVEVRRRSLMASTGVLLLSSPLLGVPGAFAANGQKSQDPVNTPYQEYQVQSESSVAALEVASKLQKLGARLYGAFWCVDCQRQKETLGKEAFAMTTFIECYPIGVRKNVEGLPDIVTPVEACGNPYDMWPMWVIPKQRGEGEDMIQGGQTIEALQKILTKYKVEN
mmetsp:Transcript_4887/g.6628  ORF Transcript_4887/g.6628 Transcript_4887/m.6628 type:complete len:211 (-) Transcript_4887:8-640(-)